jgi:hypothetical protein
MTPLRCHEGVLEARQWLWRWVEGEAGREVAVGTLAADGSVEESLEGVVDYADDGAFLDDESEGDADVGVGVHEVRRAEVIVCQFPFRRRQRGVWRKD